MITLLAALVPILVLGIVGTVFTVPFVALGPGPTFNTLGEVQGKPVVDVTGTPVDPTSGNLNMTTVAVRDELSIFEALGYWVSGRHGIVPRSQVYPPGVSRDQVDRSNQQEFATSESNAEVAALRFLHKPTMVTVRDVSPDSPTAKSGTLRAGDQLVTVDGKPVATAQDVVNAVSSRPPGSSITVVWRRDGAEQTGSIQLGAHPNDPSKGFLGITPVATAQPPMHVAFNLADIGGPSAGLMFSLALLDKLSPGELDGGKFIAGTGTIDADGGVGPIGGIPYKMIAAREAGAQAFLVPAGNCQEAKQHAPAGLQLIKVDTLNTAVSALDDLNRGRPTPTCSA